MVEATEERAMTFVGQDRNEVMIQKLRETGEPFFVLRAQDALASALVYEWANRAEFDDTGRPRKYVSGHNLRRW